MDLDQFTAQVNLQSVVFPVMLVVLMLVALAVINRRQLSSRWMESRAQSALNRIGGAQLHDVIIADGVDGYHHIDRLVMTRDSILVIAYKRYDGLIFCGEQIAEWTQVVGQKSFKFNNPLFELEHQIATLEQLIADVPVVGYLYFNENATFPKGHPETVLRQHHLPDFLLDANLGMAPASVFTAWEKLKSSTEDPLPTGRLRLRT